MGKRKPRKRNFNLLNELNSVAILPNELWEISDKVHKEREEINDWEPINSMYVIARYYNFSSPLKIQAVYFRMIALVKIIKNGLVGWTFPRQEDDGIPTNYYVFAAAAIEPLVPLGDDFCFEKNAFLDRVLTLAEAEGNA
jgi:hypothetical protein